MALVVTFGCSKHEPTSNRTAAPSPSVSGTIDVGHRPTTTTAVDILESLGSCTLGHRGILLDLGDTASHFRLGLPPADAAVESIERDGATWARVHERTLNLTFTAAPQDVMGRDVDDAPPDVGVTVDARVRGLAAKKTAVFLNGKPLGTWTLDGTARTVSARTTGTALVAGTNELLLRFSAMGPHTLPDEPLAEIDWIHVGPGDSDPSYAAPTKTDVLGRSAVGGIAKRAVSLRAPGFVRCTNWFSPELSLEVSVGIAGRGEGDAEIRLYRDRLPPLVLKTVHVASESGQWIPLSIPFRSLGTQGTLATLELRSVRSTKGTRVLFGEPRVVSPMVEDDQRGREHARNAVVVVFGSVSAAVLGVYGGACPSVELASLGSTGTVFEEHRASSSLASASFASLLTGVEAQRHGLLSPSDRLPRGRTNLAEVARQAKVTTALFTANPTTGRAFGFDRGWDTFYALAPTDDAPAVKIFETASVWLDEHKLERFLIVIHARGGHPPWSVTQADLKALPPENYTGFVDPKVAGESLSHNIRSSNRLTDADRARIWALYSLSVAQHDAALGRLVTKLRDVGHFDDTLLWVTSDIAMNAVGSLPFAEGEGLDEGVLGIPLVAHGPGFNGGGKRVALATAPSDLPSTILAGLGLGMSLSFAGDDLYSIARGERLRPRPSVARVAERFSARWGPFVLSGTLDRETKLCNLALEPGCVSDVRLTHPIAYEALHQNVFMKLGGRDKAERAFQLARETVTLDSQLLSNLKLWGR